MELWGTAIFLIALALAVVALVSRYEKRVNRLANVASAPTTPTQYGDALFADKPYDDEPSAARDGRAKSEQDEKNEMAWAWRLSALEERVWKLIESQNRVRSEELRSLQLAVSHSADKTRTALDRISHVEESLDKLLDDVAGDISHLTGIVNRVANTDTYDSTPEEYDSTPEEYDSTPEDLRLFCCGGCRASNGKNCEAREFRCVHDNPIAFHDEGGCDT